MTTADIVVILVACLIGSLVKAVTGMGFPIIAIPIISLFVSLEDAVVVVALPNLVSNSVLAFRERSRFAATRDLPALAVAGIAGAVLGTILFVSLPDEPLVIGLVLIVVGYVGVYFVRADEPLAAATSRRWAPVAGFVGGLFQGGIGISGPIIGSWIHSYRLERSAHVLSVTVLFFVTGFTQVSILLADGQYADRWAVALLAIVPTLVMIPLGVSLRDRLSVRGFDYVILAIIIGSAVSLVFRTFA